MDRKHRIVIATDHPQRRWLMVGGSVAAIMFAAFGLYRYTRATTVSDFERAQTERDRLVEEQRALARELRAAKADNQSLKEQIAYLGRSGEIDTVACASVKKSLTDLQSQAGDLREQLAFYRGIVSPKESQAGVRVYDFKLKPSEKDRPEKNREYKFDLVLIQSVRQDKRMAGSVEVSIEGLKNGQKLALKLRDIAQAPKPDMVFSFKYFEEITGTLSLPDGFRPLRAVVTLEPDGASAPAIQDEYEWGKITQEVSTQ